MSTSVSWPTIGGTSYSVPATGELNWQALSNFLIALGNKAQSIDNTKLAIRTGVTTPISVASNTDCVVISNLTVPGAVGVTLPAGITGQVFFVVDGKGDAATNNVTITPNGAELINGSATYVINKNRAGILLGFNGVGWTVLAEYTSIANGTIPRSSIATGTPNHVVINSGTGALSSEAQLAKSRGGTGADNSSVTFPSTGVVTTDAGTATLTGKTIDGDDNTIQDLGVASLKTVIGQANTFLSFNGSGAPIVTKVVPTGAVLGTTDAQVVTAKDIDGGTASNTSRITLPGNTTANLTALTRKAGTVVYDSSLGAFKGDNGSALITFAATSVATPTATGTVTSYFPTIASGVNTVTNANYTVLTTDGFQNILMSTGGTNRTLTLPTAASNIGRMLTVTKIDSGTGYVTLAGGLTTKLFLIGESLTVTCDGTSWYVVNYSPNGSYQSYTPGTAGLGSITIGTDGFQWQRVGRYHMKIWGRFQIGTTTAAEARVNLPTGYTIATTNGKFIVGAFWRNITNANNQKRGVLQADSAVNTYMTMSLDDYTSPLSPLVAQLANAVVGSAELLAFDALIPIVEFV